MSTPYVINKDNFKDPDEVNRILLKGDITYEESQMYYKKWAEIGTYGDVHETKNNIYTGQIQIVEAMKNLFSDVTSVKVLDAGAGTGLTGEQLHILGYTNVDALEPLPEFAEICRQRGFYKNIFNQPVGREVPVPVPDDTYDAITVVGSFGPGAIPPSAIPEFVRIIKPGGYFVNCMREEYLWTVPQYKDKLVPLLDALEKQRKIEKIEWNIYPKHWKDLNGIRMIYKIL